MKNPAISRAKSARPMARLRTKALTAMPSLFWPVPRPASINPTKPPPTVALVSLAILSY